MLWVLRISLYVQVVLGIARLAAALPEPRIWELHRALAVVIVILALVALRPIAGVPGSGIRQLARFAPIAPLALGLLMMFGVVVGMPVIVLHALLGLATVALVEMASARQRRALASA